MDKLPCETCIVLPICKLKLKELSHHFPRTCLTILKIRCPILNNYINDSTTEEDTIIVSSKKHELYKFFYSKDLEDER
jgi:hypothetical protein